MRGRYCACPNIGSVLSFFYCCSSFPFVLLFCITSQNFKRTNFKDCFEKLIQASKCNSLLTLAGMSGTTEKKRERDLYVYFCFQGNVLRSEVDGCIQMKSFVAGNPEIRIGLNDDFFFDKSSLTSQGK